MKGKNMMWAYLVHISYNMWSDRDVPEVQNPHIGAKPYLRFDESLWDEILRRLVEARMNAVVLDLGDGIKYESHPEIAVENAWTIGRLKEEIGRLRDMGLEPIPKLNFSTTHDAWLGKYSRCVSTDVYYEVCQDLISEVCEIFDGPRLFHLGMDEETAQHQRHYRYVVVRQYDLWWEDLQFYVRHVEKAGTRAWIWSDYLWHHPEEFFKNMPKSVLQSNWYYGAEFKEDIPAVKAYLDLEAHGYDQVPTGSNWSIPENFQRTVEYCRTHIDPQHLLGFLQTSWRPTLEEFRRQHMEAIEVAAKARAEWED